MKSTRALASGCAALGLALLVAAGPAGAQAQWKWRGADGRVQYSDRPPPASVAEKDIIARPSGARRYDAQDFGTPPPETPLAASGAAPAMKDPELEAKRREAEQALKAKQKAEEEKIARQRADNCARARSYVKALEDGIRITRANEKGENELLDDNQRVQELSRARQIVATDCAS